MTAVTARPEPDVPEPDVAHLTIADLAVAAADLSALGTAVRLVLTDPTALTAATRELTRRLDRLDLACSRFRADSELRRLEAANAEWATSRSAGTGSAGGAPARPVRISPLLAELIDVALRAARLSDGDVDPTVGAAVAAAGYDRDFALVPPNGPAIRVVAGPAPGWRRIRLDRNSCELTVPAGILIDLGATAKAWAADDAAAAIAARFGCGALVSLGGDVAMAGPAPAGGWSVRVQDVVGHPGDPAPESSVTVLVRTGGLATSSLTARRWARGGIALHHLFDPRTGLPAQTPWRTVSVAAASCVDANIASTSAIIRGQPALARLRTLRLPARLVALDGTVTTVAGWPAERRA